VSARDTDPADIIRANKEIADDRKPDLIALLERAQGKHALPGGRK
jgi:hypothetical protein